MTIRIFQKGFNFSQDGPGNRLVYHLQGCNLRCPWCSNPEGLEVSAANAAEYSVDEILDEVRRSRMMFFDGGGVTLTGGEVTMQSEAVKELLCRLKELGIHTCIETNGLCPSLPELFDSLDLLIMDIKHYDPEKHREVTGLPNTVTVNNIRATVEAGQPLALRIPLIGGFNASRKDAEGFAALLTGLGAAKHATLELLPYHEYGKSKYASLGLEYRMDSTAKITGETLSVFSDVLRSAGIRLIHT